MAPKKARSNASAVATQRSEIISAATSCARWIRAAAGGDTATVRVAMPDAGGRLQVVACEGQSDGSGRLRSRRRRAVFRTRRAVHLPVQGSVGITLGIFPLTSGDDAIGVVEVLGPTATFEERADVLRALVEHSGRVLGGAHVRSEAERARDGMSSLLGLASDLLWASTATEMLRLAVTVCHRHLGVPVAGLLPDRDGWGWFLAAADGMGARARSSLRASLRASGSELTPRRLLLSSVRGHFQEVVRCDEVLTVRPGTAVLLLGDVPDGNGDFIRGIGSLLSGVLPRQRAERAGVSRDRTSELGIAWTAHELKGPLVGARAALERASETATVSEGQELLRRTREELGQLSDLIDPLLRWSTGTVTLRRRRVDLVQVAREAVVSSSLGLDKDRVTIDGPNQMYVRGDPRQLKSAIANVVRNALKYSPAGTPVRVNIERDDRWVRLAVQDRGPGVPIEERRNVFDPFFRGRDHGRTRSGTGLGLFIARRVLEAHGGSISLRPSRLGATFVLEVPAEGWQLSAS